MGKETTYQLTEAEISKHLEEVDGPGFYKVYSKNAPFPHIAGMATVRYYKDVWVFDYVGYLGQRYVFFKIVPDGLWIPLVNPQSIFARR